MATARRFEDLEAWQKARELVREIYKVGAQGNFGRDFALRDQICRAAGSSMSNIAEGFSRNSDRDFAHFLDIARSSTSEVQSLLYVALDISHIETSEFDKLYKLADETASRIGGLILYLRKHS